MLKNNLKCDGKDSEFLPDIKPEGGDIVIDKTCDNPFNCTGLEDVLTNLNSSYIIVCGVRGGGYLNTTALDAADRGFGVIVVSDAVASEIYHGTHPMVESLNGGLIRVRLTSSLIEELSELTS